MEQLFNLAEHKVADAAEFRLKDHATKLKRAVDKDRLKHSVKEDAQEIGRMQQLLFAENSRSLLLIFQAMDAGGKDSCIARVLRDVNPQGCRVTSFKTPSTEELDHDFLWRHAKAAPAKGMLGVHNRSHYEEVLVVKVHPEYLLGQHLPRVRTAKDADNDFWEQRYASIRGFEEHLAGQGTTIMKFFLNMGREAQKERFLERIEDPEKNGKFSMGDVKERAHWDHYMQAYEKAIAATSTKQAPWYVVPADEQWETRAIVCRAVREQLEAMDPRIPALSATAMAELPAAAKALREEKDRPERGE